MKITLYMAISIDGYVAGKNDDTSWVSSTDWDNFRKLVKDSRCVVMGRRTYEESGDDFPYDCELNVVMTTNNSLTSTDKRVLFTDKNPNWIIEFVKRKGFNTLLIIGGGKTNASFLKEQLIDEIIVSVHPIILGEGIKLFEKLKNLVNLELLGNKQLDEGLVQLHYKVKK